MKVMFLDESGDHKLKKINPKFPAFALGGIIVDRSYVRDVMEPRVRQFKRRFWGREDVLLHTVDIRNNAGDFSFLTEPARRDDFFTELNAMLDELEYKVLVVVIKKYDFVEKYRECAVDPYKYAFEMVIDRFCVELGNNLDPGFICAEKRGSPYGGEVMAAWEKLRSEGTGTGYASSKRIDARIVGLDLRDKRPNLAGAQIADLVVTPAARYVLDLPPKPEQVQWSVVEAKLRRVNGSYWGMGLVVKP